MSCDTRTLHCAWCGVRIPAVPHRYVIDGHVPPHDIRLVVSVEEDGHRVELCVTCYDKACVSGQVWPRYAL